MHESDTGNFRIATLKRISISASLACWHNSCAVLIRLMECHSIVTKSQDDVFERQCRYFITVSGTRIARTCAASSLDGLWE